MRRIEADDSADPMAEMRRVYDWLGIERASLVELLQASSGRSFTLEVRARMESPAGFRHGGALLRKDLRLLGEVLGDDHAAARCLTDAAERFLAAAAERQS